MHLQQLADKGLAYHAPSFGFCKTSGLQVFAVKMTELKIILSWSVPKGCDFFVGTKCEEAAFKSEAILQRGEYFGTP
jgi:hypothetical protein